MILEILRIIGIFLGYPLQLLFFKRKTYYEDKSRRPSFKGAKLIVSNHYNMWDYVQNNFVVFPRKLNVVTAEESFRNWFFALGMKIFGGIKCDRSTKSMKFLDDSIQLLKKGQLVQIFPEGANTPDGKIHEFKLTYLAIAHRAKVPIIPIVIDGNYGFFKRASVIMGNEIDLSQFFSSENSRPTRKELENANDYIYNKVLELREELERRKQRRKNGTTSK